MINLESILMGKPAWWWLQHTPSAVFVFCFGACVGSFLNVVIYRLPAGMSLSTPPSRCPVCGARLKFFRENLPIIGWFLIRGKCRYCGVPVSPQYMFIELMMALMFLGLYVMLYMVGPYTPWFGELGGPWWDRNTIVASWPAFVGLAFMLSGLVAMTVIDARTFTIPMPIPLFITFTAFVAYALQAVFAKVSLIQAWPIPPAGWHGVAISFGGMLGILASYILLRTGRIRYSFADYGAFLPPQPGSLSDDAVQAGTGSTTVSEMIFLLPCVIGLVAGTMFAWWIGIVAAIVTALIPIVLDKAGWRIFESEAEPTGDAVLAPNYPHARREMKHEVLYLLPCLCGMAMGWVVSRWLPAGSPPLALAALGASFAGYLVGGGLVWAIRIIGTLAFGREAMGLGDVHLLAAVGAVLGWFDPILIFFIAPFSGLAWAFGSMGLSSLFKRARRELPYGPHLAVATLAVMLCRPGLHELWMWNMPRVPWPDTSVAPTPPRAATGALRRPRIGTTPTTRPVTSLP